MQLTPLLISILLLVSSKLKPLEPTYRKITSSLVTFHRPITNLKGSLDQTKLLVSSFPNIQYNNLELKAKNSQLKTQNLLLKNQLNLENIETPAWNTVSIRIIKANQIITATSNQTDQIKPGMPLVQSTNLIGLVQKIQSSIIYILPLSNDSIFFPVQTNQDTQGDYVFQNNTAQMINIPNQNTPGQDNTVFTLPTDQIPEGLIIGQVAQTITKPSDPMQKVEITLPQVLYTQQNQGQPSQFQIITKP